MTRTKLINMDSGALEPYAISSMPSYLAASHAWSDNMFAIHTEYKNTLGGMMIDTSVRKLFPDIKYCWIDTICIDQNNEEDKKRQIPLMGDIYGNAEVVVIVTTCDFPNWMTQDYLDQLTKDLDEAIAISMEEEYTESMSEYWAHGDGRQKIIDGMNCLEFFTRTRWADRIWTLQEYILARQIVWLGKESVCLRIDDALFSALPDLCDVFDIKETIGGKYAKIYEFYTGMVNAGAGKIDRTRVMELLGNRTASFPDDEVYGAMAASGVVIQPGIVFGQDNVWALWWEEAIRQGHHRWMFLPPVLSESISQNCLMPPFKTRHKASQYSGLDKINIKSGQVTIEDGSINISGRWAGFCHIVRRLGKVFRDENGGLLRDITIILFANGSWQLALRLVAAFGGGRYTWKQCFAIAQILKANHYHAKRAVYSRKEHKMILRKQTSYQRTVWADFMRLMMSQMVPMNEGIAYLACVKNKLKSTDIIIVSDDNQPLDVLQALDFGIQDVSKRTPFMIVSAPASSLTPGQEDCIGALHKIGISIPTMVYKTLRKACAYKGHMIDGDLHKFNIGGKTCWFCSKA
ncbi:2ed1829e-25a6-415b-8ed4-e43cd78d2a94 [Sclerotinia trifoliorum]|uniref:2ed1829e-25a6-415b-8ed4-e43cd78d2a94 n=1 Tax=Sclerotinia trifoliorum TaxID=28548 RepID=A0A8H2VWQ7_9HELO|nr:2ed1829e-25a6-415b-8ed4-e43cd78d2a94 [Sclerotinia trifoliorum]